MSTHRITPEQVRRIEEALEERKPKSDRRQKEAPVGEDGERRVRSDRRKANNPEA